MCPEGLEWKVIKINISKYTLLLFDIKLIFLDQADIFI